MVDHPNIPPSVMPWLRTLADHPLVEGIRLFGSRRFGDHAATSDVDIAVHAPNLSRGDWAKLRDAAGRARTLYSITLTHFESNPPDLQRRILQTGELIYAATKAARRLGESSEIAIESGAGLRLAEGAGSGH